MLQARNSRPQQRHGPGNMGSGHRSSAGGRITTVAGIVARSCARPRSSDVWFYTIATVDCDRAAITEPSNRIRAGIQSSDCIRRRIPRRRAGLGASTDVVDATASGTIITRSDYHLDTSSFLSFNGVLQFVADNAAL